MRALLPAPRPDTLNLAGNDYLNLAHHPKLIAAARQASLDMGVAGGASRLVTGNLPIHGQLESAFTQLKHPNDEAFASLLFPTGYMANLGLLTTLANEPDDLLLLDKLCHASLIDAARAAPATFRTFPHRDTDRAAALLERHRQQHPDALRFLVTDSVFSMDGDTADLPALCELADRYDATVITDDAHATGVLPAAGRGAGLAEAQGVADRVHLTVSTCSKALAGLGGVVTAPRPVIDTLVNEARPFIYTTAPPPAQAAATLAALEVVRDEPERREHLADLSLLLRDALQKHGWPLPNTQPVTPIIPLIVGDPDAAISLSDQLTAAGFRAVAIRPPTVAPNTARVRLSLHAGLTHDDIDRLLQAIPHPSN